MSAAKDTPSKQSILTRFLQNARSWSVLYLLAAPTILSLAIFSYYPKIDVVIMSFFRWEPPSIKEFVGLENFKTAFADPQFWDSFKLVGILLLANLLKLWPGILAAVALHRLRNDRLRYLFQVLFVVPMIIPAMVWLLIWKTFYEPSLGLLNKFLNTTGMMQVLQFLDTAMPKLSIAIAPVNSFLVQPVFGNLAGMILFGVFVLFMASRKEFAKDRHKDYSLLLGIGLLPIVMIPLLSVSALSLLLIIPAIAYFCFLLSNRFHAMWILWAFGAAAGTFIFRDELWRLPTAILAAIAIFEFIRRRGEYYNVKPFISAIGWITILLASLIVTLGHIWTFPIEQFDQGTPAWLGNSNLVIPALLFWGFPWVGSVGVLIYLSGLQNIPQSVYEAAEIDGVGPIGSFFYVELPLIMTQIRINLIFMTIGTLTAYEMFLILLGPEGGPGNKGMVPGLYMFSSAFTEGRFGYACALGMVLFVVILTLTIIYQKYVKVDK